MNVWTRSGVIVKRLIAQIANSLSALQVPWYVQVVVGLMAALYVCHETDWSQVSVLLREANATSFVVAVGLFNASQWLSAHRLAVVLRAHGIVRTFAEHLRLYYVGMLFNNVVPGGVGGDVVKATRYKTPTTHWRNVIRALLLDRIVGVIALVALLLASTAGAWQGNAVGITGAGAAVVVALGLCGRKATRMVGWTLLVSLGVQALQVGTAYSAAPVEATVLPVTLVLLASSLATIIPVSLGGIGVREAAAIILAPYAGVTDDGALVVTLTFSLIQIASAGLGGVAVLALNGSASLQHTKVK